MTAKIFHAEIWGRREEKYQWLEDQSLETTDWQQLDPAEPFFLFKPFDRSAAGNYDHWPSITDVMPVNVTGIVTARDHFVIDFDRKPLIQRIAELRNTSISDQAVRDKYFTGKGSKKYPPGDSRGWKLPHAREKLQADEHWDAHAAPILYRPFDIRQIYYVPWMVDWPRTEAMHHMTAHENLGFELCRQTVTSNWCHVLATNQITDDSYVSNRTRERGYLFALYLYPNIGNVDPDTFTRWPPGQNSRRPNLDPTFVHTVEQTTSLTFTSDGRGDLDRDFGPEDVLAYIYAVFHWPDYRRRFEPMLRLDFPRVPPPDDADRFVSFARLGDELLTAHLLEDEAISGESVAYPAAGDNVVEKGYPKYVPPGAPGRAPVKAGHARLEAHETFGRVYINPAQYFEAVEPAVWRFQIGGYQVCEKWLKDRRGRTLDFNDLTHYTRIVEALRKTIDLMNQIEAAGDGASA